MASTGHQRHVAGAATRGRAVMNAESPDGCPMPGHEGASRRASRYRMRLPSGAQHPPSENSRADESILQISPGGRVVAVCSRDVRTLERPSMVASSAHPREHRRRAFVGRFQLHRAYRTTLRADRCSRVSRLVGFQRARGMNPAANPAPISSLTSVDIEFHFGQFHMICTDLDE